MRERVPRLRLHCAAARALSLALVILASVTQRRPTPSSSVEADYVPRFLSPTPPSLSILFDLYLYSEGTQASTLWRVSSWSPSRSCSFRCVSSSPSTLTSTASFESTSVAVTPPSTTLARRGRP